MSMKFKHQDPVLLFTFMNDLLHVYYVKKQVIE